MIAITISQNVPLYGQTLNNMIPFNKPYLTGEETDYIKQAVENGKKYQEMECLQKKMSINSSIYHFGLN